MKKTDKKIDNALRVALTQVCDDALKEIPGFQWLTHLVHFSNFPSSLAIICVFDSNENLQAALVQQHDAYFYQQIESALNAIDVSVKNIKRHVHFDTEEACWQQHQGRWHERLKG